MLVLWTWAMGRFASSSQSESVCNDEDDEENESFDIIISKKRFLLGIKVRDLRILQRFWPDLRFLIEKLDFVIKLEIVLNWDL
jgi:hypothetical protein